MSADFEKRSEYKRQWYRANAARILAEQARSRAENPPSMKEFKCAQCGKPYLAFPKGRSVTCSPACAGERVRILGRERNKLNADRIRERAQRRYAEMRAAAAPAIPHERSCVECGASFLAGPKSRAKLCSLACRAACLAKTQARASAKRRTGRATTPGTHSAADRAKHLRVNFGMTPQGFADMLLAQGGGCALCGAVEPRGPGAFHVDHDHVTGRVRGLLCHSCNVGLGHFKDDPALLLKAAEYLCSHSELAPGLKVVA